VAYIAAAVAAAAAASVTFVDDCCIRVIHGSKHD